MDNNETLIHDFVSTPKATNEVTRPWKSNLYDVDASGELIDIDHNRCVVNFKDGRTLCYYIRGLNKMHCIIAIKRHENALVMHRGGMTGRVVFNAFKAFLGELGFRDGEVSFKGGMRARLRNREGVFGWYTSKDGQRLKIRLSDLEWKENDE